MWWKCTFVRAMKQLIQQTPSKIFVKSQVTDLISHKRQKFRYPNVHKIFSKYRKDSLIRLFNPIIKKPRYTRAHVSIKSTIFIIFFCRSSNSLFCWTNRLLGVTCNISCRKTVHWSHNHAICKLNFTIFFRLHHSIWEYVRFCVCGRNQGNRQSRLWSIFILVR